MNRHLKFNNSDISELDVLIIPKTCLDEPVSSEMNEEWQQITEGITHVSEIMIPRWIGIQRNSKIQLHGFSDASERAYAAVLYTRTILPNGRIRVSLVASKTRVAPLKQVSIPRLELQGAHLLVELIERIEPLFERKIESIFNWCDSTIVLHWLKKSPARLKVFAANRVATIQEKSVSQGHKWQWIFGKENPTV